MKRYKLTVYVPLNAADSVREAMGKAGAGCLGEYSCCSFSYRGTGRFLPNDKAQPHIGQSGILEAVEEESIEVIISENVIHEVIKSMKEAHPYEEEAYHVVSLEVF